MTRHLQISTQWLILLVELFNLWWLAYVFFSIIFRNDFKWRFFCTLKTYPNFVYLFSLSLYVIVKTLTCHFIPPSNVIRSRDSFVNFLIKSIKNSKQLSFQFLASADFLLKIFLKHFLIWTYLFFTHNNLTLTFSARFRWSVRIELLSNITIFFWTVFLSQICPYFLGHWLKLKVEIDCVGIRVPIYCRLIASRSKNFA